MQLIPNAKQVALRSYSQWAMASATALLGSYGALPDKMQDLIPVPVLIGLTCTILVLGFIGRLIAQPELAPPKDGQE